MSVFEPERYFPRPPSVTAVLIREDNVLDIAEWLNAQKLERENPGRGEATTVKFTLYNGTILEGIVGRHYVVRSYIPESFNYETKVVDHRTFNDGWMKNPCLEGNY